MPLQLNWKTRPPPASGERLPGIPGEVEGKGEEGTPAGEEGIGDEGGVWKLASSELLDEGLRRRGRHIGQRHPLCHSLADERPEQLPCTQD